MPEKRPWLRWMFTGAGLVLLFLPRQLFNWPWFVALAVRLFPDARRPQLYFLAALSILFLAIGILSQATAWGLKRQRGWARWTGIISSLGMLPVFPWLTVPGFIGLAVLIMDPPEGQAPTVDRTRLRPRESGWQSIISVLTGAMWVVGFTLLARYARTLGFTGRWTSIEFWTILVVGELVVVAVHEFGHAFLAWGVGFRFKSICIGPVTTWRDAVGRRYFKFDWKKLLLAGGYMGSVPTSEKSLRMNQILVTFAGPFLSLNAGLLLFLLFLRLPGTSLEQYWKPIGMVALLFVVDFIRNLIPIGYTDGTILLHLLLWTKKGQEFSSAWLSAKDAEAAEQVHEQKDFDEEIAARKRVLDQARAHGEVPSAALAANYQALGFAYLGASESDEAEQNLKRSLEIGKQCHGVHPLLEANSWLGLQRVFMVQHRAVEAQGAAGSAIRAFENAKKKLKRPEYLEVQGAVALLYSDSGDDYAALQEIEQALALYPAGRSHLRRKAHLLGLQARSEFRIGRSEAALALVEEAAGILRSGEIPETDRIQAAGELGTIGLNLWMAGRSAQGARLLSEAIRMLEERVATRQAAHLGIVLAEMYRKSGRLQEADAALPAAEGLRPRDRVEWMDQRALIQLKRGLSSDAVVLLEQALALQKEFGRQSPREVASLERSLSDAFLDAGRLEEAEAVARRACDVFVPLRHPDAADPLVTLAIVLNLRHEESAEAYLEEALQLIAEAPLLQTSSRARFLDAQSVRLDRFGWGQKAREVRAAAQSHWQKLGLVGEDLAVVSEQTPEKVAVQVGEI